MITQTIKHCPCSVFPPSCGLLATLKASVVVVTITGLAQCPSVVRPWMEGTSSPALRRCTAAIPVRVMSLCVGRPEPSPSYSNRIQTVSSPISHCESLGQSTSPSGSAWRAPKLKARNQSHRSPTLEVRLPPVK